MKTNITLIALFVVAFMFPSIGSVDTADAETDISHCANLEATVARPACEAAALGNMLDRRAEGQLGNDAQKIDENLENKYACQNTETFKTQGHNEENKKGIFIIYQLCTIPSNKEEIVI
jgi:hypothetical protein